MDKQDLIFKIAVISTIVIILALLAYFGADIWHWILTVTGDQSAGTRWNLAWSGFLSAGVISGSIFTHAYQHARGANCHNKGCWRIGNKITDDGHKLCHRCAGLPLTALNLPFIHPDHKAEESSCG